MDFYAIIILSMIVILIVSLATFGYVLYEGASNAKFPPYFDKCPDYWTWDESGTQCLSDQKNTGINNVRVYKPNADFCTNHKWAKDNRIQWDGIINTNECPK
jgi:hypothetical protein